MSGLFEELKRRNVFRVGVAYVMLGWVVIQVTDVVVPALNLPLILNSIVVYIGIIGFPFALFFAWAFELTPDGVKRSNEVSPEQSTTSTTARKLEHLAVGLLLVAVVLLLWDRNSADNPSGDGGALITNANASIAVLPFVNMSADPEQEYFSDGISEEILNVLAKLPGLHVTSRSSAFSYKGKEINISNVAKELGVATILEGSVRKSGTKIRITAQLIQADGDKHLWSKTYDRELDDIFAIQDEISAAIVAELKEHLGLVQDVQITAQDGRSENPLAYEAYLKGHHQLLMRTNESINASIDMFKYALNLDDNFALAHAELAIAHMLLVENQYGNLSIDEVYFLAKPHADKAMELAPNDSSSIAAAGFVLWDRKASDEVIALFNKALEAAPNDASIMNWLGIIYGDRGEYQKSNMIRERLAIIDPLNISNLTNYVLALADIGNFEKSEEILERLSAISPAAYNQSLAGHLSWQGHYADAAHNNLKTLVMEPKSGLTRSLSGYSIFFLGLYKEAIILSPVDENSFLVDARNYREAIEKINAAQTPLSNEDKIFLSMAYAGIGQYEKALPILEEWWVAGGKRASSTFGYSFKVGNAAALVASRRAFNKDADVEDVLMALDEEIVQLKKANVRISNIQLVESIKDWINGDLDSAVAKIRQATNSSIFRSFHYGDYYSELNANPEYQQMLAAFRAHQKIEREKFLSQVCKSNPYSSVWTPLAENCAPYQ